MGLKSSRIHFIALPSEFHVCHYNWSWIDLEWHGDVMCVVIGMGITIILDTSHIIWERESLLYWGDSHLVPELESRQTHLPPFNPSHLLVQHLQPQPPPQPPCSPCSPCPCPPCSTSTSRLSDWGWFVLIYWLQICSKRSLCCKKNQPGGVFFTSSGWFLGRKKNLTSLDFFWSQSYLQKAKKLLENKINHRIVLALKS